MSAPAEVSLKNILVATDLELGSLSAPSYVLPLARQFHSTVHILYVVRPELSDLVSPAKSSLMFEQLPTVAQQLLNSLAISLGDAPRVAKAGQGVEVVKDLVRFNHIDLVGVGASGKTHLSKIPWATHLLDRVYEIISFSSCPV